MGKTWNSTRLVITFAAAASLFALVSAQAANISTVNDTNTPADNAFFVNSIIEHYGDGVSISVSQVQNLLNAIHVVHRGQSEGEADLQHSDTPTNDNVSDQKVTATENDVTACDVSVNRTKECLETKCLNATDIFTIYGITVQAINGSVLHDMSTALLYTAQDSKCTQAVNETEDSEVPPDPAAVWGYSFLCVTVINLCSLMGMVFLPLMKKSFYKRLLMFMVALAVGTLSGSSLLFLIPECFEMSSEHNPAYHDYVWKCTTVLGGIYLFFLLERLMKNIMDWRKKIVKFDSDPSSMDRTTTESYEPLKRDSGAVACPENELIGSVKTRAVHLTDSMNMSFSVPATTTANSGRNSMANGKRGSRLISTSSDVESHYPRSRNESTSSQRTAPVTGSTADGNVQAASSAPQDVTSPTPGETTENYEEYLRPNMSSVELLNNMDQNALENAGSDSRPPSIPSDDSDKDIKSVAWMVIFGDGLHNFIDGLSIGAAFSKNILAGVSVSLAVVCEELPHELGDFAILLNSGMSMKQALSYNFLSACMCYLGLVLGIVVGEMTTGSTWIFALAAGMFLYISLVDMLPEVNHAAEEETKLTSQTWRIFFLQNAGLLSGYGIMLLLAVYSGEIDFES